MIPPSPTRETIYDGPTPELRPEQAEASLEDLEQIERDVNRFMVHIFGWIAGALLISAFFASYSDQWREGVLLEITSRTVFFLIGGMLAMAFFVSRKVENLPTSVAMAILVAYAAIQGSLFGLAYRSTYHFSLAPAYLCMALVLALLCVYGSKTHRDLTSASSLLLGCFAALLIATCSKVIFGQPVLTAVAACVGAWLTLALACYHRDFLRDLASSFDDDPNWEKAAAIGALQVYLDLVIIVVIVIQLRWLEDFLSEAERTKGFRR